MNVEGREKPHWLRVRAPTGQFSHVRAVLSQHRVYSVCDVSQCPTISECWSRSSATFMILGRICTRSCAFCAVRSGQRGEEVDEGEPARIARAAWKLGLRHVVITSVTRDDLHDFGAGHFAATVDEVRRINPLAGVEVLVPDFQGSGMAVETVIASTPDVFGHNIETVRSLQEAVRDRRAVYENSLAVLSRAKESGDRILTKSSIMLGLGEERGELLEAMRDLRAARVDMLALGQYLKPRGSPLEVERYVPPSEFEELKAEALKLGFKAVSSGPFVRSSYKAIEMLGSGIGV